MTFTNDPILPPWYIPGWGVQHPSYPANTDTNPALSLPTSLEFVNVVGTFFHIEGGPQPGSMTFTPSVALDWDDPDSEHVIRLNPAQQKVYLNKGQLYITLLASDNENVTPNLFSYHVVENWMGGQEYDIIVPKDVTQPVEIKTLVVQTTDSQTVNSMSWYPGDSFSVTFVYPDQTDISDLTGVCSFYTSSGHTDITVSPDAHSFTVELNPSQTQSFKDTGVTRFIFKVHDVGNTFIQTIASGPVTYLHPYGA